MSSGLVSGSERLNGRAAERVDDAVQVGDLVRSKSPGHHAFRVRRVSRTTDGYPSLLAPDRQWYDGFFYRVVPR